MSRTSMVLLALYGSGALSSAVGAQTVQTVDYTQVTRPVVEIADPDLIEYLLFELIIEPLERPTRLQVIDVTQNGYGPDDVIVVFPSAEAFLIPELLPDSVQSVMSSWAPEVEFRLDSGNLPADALAAMIGSDADSSTQAENAILYDVVQAVERNYRDLPVGIRFERDSVGFTFQMWDYNRDAMEYTPRPAFAADSTVTSVVSLLKDIGYVPGRSDAGLVRTAEGVASVDKALLGIRSFPSERTRQLATRTVLLGTYDFDRSGSIDRAREIDALPCSVWTALDGTFPGVLDRFGFVDSMVPYSGNIVLSISENVRVPASRRGLACLTGSAPPPTAEEDVVVVGDRAPLPAPVAGFLAMEGAAEIVANAGAVEPGSANWSAAVESVLLARFDADSSGQLDRSVEVEAVPCVVWRAVVSTHEDVVTDLGFDGGRGYVGDRIGVGPEQREVAASRIRSCLVPAEETVPLRVAPVAAPPGDTRSAQPYAAATPLAGIRAIPEEERRQLAARTILRAFFDFDRSGYIDTADELDAMSCDVWNSLDLAFPGFAEEYGFVEGAGAASRTYRGSIIFNISDRLREPAARRAAACSSGQVPPRTTVDDVSASSDVIRLPTELRQFLDTENAVRIARMTARLEPGSAAWAAVVRSVLIDVYDLDASGMIDTAIEVDEVPCVVWNTIEATYGKSLGGLGFDGASQYLGDRIGLDSGQRERVGQQLQTCAP